jgi:hypothetical protein
MNLVHAAKVDRLREAFEQGLSVRQSAQYAGIAKDTACRYFRLWRISKEPARRGLMANLDPPLSPAFVAEARRRKLTATALANRILATVSKDNLFAALLDE